MLDTDAIVAALRSPKGASAALLRAARAGRVMFLATAPLFLGDEAVYRRAEHRRTAGFDDHDLDVFLAALADLVEPVEAWFLWRPQRRDPGDEMVLEAAVNGRAEAIVTFNRRDFRPAVQRFGLAILLPAAAIERVR